MMERVLTGLQYKSVLVYVDDVIIYSRSFEQHLVDVEAVMERLEQAGLTCKLKKCDFGVQQCEFLGHVIGVGRCAHCPN